MRVYTKGRRHAKAYIFDYDSTRIRSSVGAGIIGSSNFSISGIVHNIELNICQNRKLHKDTHSPIYNVIAVALGFKHSDKMRFADGGVGCSTVDSDSFVFYTHLV